MSKATTQFEKETFIGLVIKKLNEKGFKMLQGRILKKSNLDVKYKTAQRYARDYLYRDDREKELFYKELYALMDNQTDTPVEAITESEAEAPVETVTKAPVKTEEVKEKERVISAVISKCNELYQQTKSSAWRVDAKKVATQKDLDEGYKVAVDLIQRCHLGIEYNTPVETITKSEDPVTEDETPVAPVKDAMPVPALWATPEAAPYLKMAGWLMAIDSGRINGTVQDAREFISTLDGYADKLQTLVVDQTKAQLKVLLQKVKECESVLDKSEVEDIWLEVGTENGELIVTPYSRETASAPVLKLSNTAESEVEPSNEDIAA